MVCKTACQQCSQTGLPILFTRYAAAYSSTDEGAAVLDKLKPSGKFKTQPGGVALQTAKYNVRMLRAGYLYIRTESNCRAPEWIGYVVHPRGYLTRFDIQHPQDAASLAACSPKEWGANRSLVWIKDAKNITTLHYMFNPDAIDPEHLKTVIETDFGAYTQSFDVAGWANGDKTATDTAIPDKDAGQWSVAEFKALKDEKVRNALDSQLHGLMGSSAIERGWGDYSVTQTVDTDNYFPTGEFAGSSRREDSIPVKQLGYEDAHGPRLRNMAKYLAESGGAIVACNDAIGIAQELGHLQAEAQMGYAHWQSAQAPGSADNVTNEWLFQTALAAQSLRELVKKGAVATTEKRIQAWDKMLDEKNQRDAELIRRNPEVATRNAETRAIAHANQQRERVAVLTAGDKEYAEFFDNAGAALILAAQTTAFEKNAARLAHLGIDQVAWLNAPGMKQAVGRYSDKDSVIGKLGGGAALSMQIAHCMAGCDTNSVGQQWIMTLDPLDDSLLARVICFNNETVKKTLKEMTAQADAKPIPGAERSVEWADALALKIRILAGRFNLGDRALAFGADSAFKPFCESAAMRKMAWPLHIASLMSVKMVKGLQTVPVTQLETWLVKHVALTGMSTMGSAATAYAGSLNSTLKNRVAAVTKKVGAAAKEVHVAHSVPEARAAGLAGLFDMSLAIIKGVQLQSNPDSRTAQEMVGNVMQSIGSMADFRAKAYEETIYKGAKGKDLYKMKVYVNATDEVQRVTLKAMRLTAFKFLTAAAAVSIWWDWQDASRSNSRGNFALRNAQAASVAATLFTLGSSTAAVLALGDGALMLSGAAWGSIAVFLGFLGAVLVLAAVVAMFWFYVPAWKEWLQDGPLNKSQKGKKPVHANLQETLQKLANAFESAGFEKRADAKEPAGAPA